MALIAKWNIKVNNKDVTTEGTTLNNMITLIPNETSNVAEGKLAPGYGGCFDIAINPEGTEVGFDYTIVFDITSLPTDVALTGYNIVTSGDSSDLTEIIDNTITGTMNLPSTSVFTTEDTKNFRIYWIWNDVRENDEQHTLAAIEDEQYSIGVSVTVTQKII